MELKEKLAALRRKSFDRHYNRCFYATMCHVCKKYGDGVTLKKCSRCGMMAYCSREHQKHDWKQHKPLCDAIQDVLRKSKSDVVNRNLDDTALVGFTKEVSIKMGRELNASETDMLIFPRKCAVCHERNGWLLEDCQNYLSISFCKDHRDSINHKDSCAPLSLCLYFNLLDASEKWSLNMDYLRQVPKQNTFQNMNDYVDAAFSLYTEDIQAFPELSHDNFQPYHSEYLTYPLTLFHAMQILDFNLEDGNLIIHVVVASHLEENTTEAWEVLLHFMEPGTILMIVMIGSQLKRKSHCKLILCDNCVLLQKQILLEFHNVLYIDYVHSLLYEKPDVVVRFNIGLEFPDCTSTIISWTSCIQMLAKQKCPLVFTRCMKLEREVDRVNAILDKKVDYLYNGKNPFGCLAPRRHIWPKQVFCANHYITVYRNLCK
ncbi:uncharacterized protein LOC105832996 [Monomorium pharaonis]|uniref:uncharacterized protein LOC105832996 n=1 Tax=Monomorium pharaonis TaxID=307658 RepID=UPI0017465D39|nr:uncharacterized protein LOC105832996 [Monomorium pharaonis]